jgi:hypothetical protein
MRWLALCNMSIVRAIQVVFIYTPVNAIVSNNMIGKGVAAVSIIGVVVLAILLNTTTPANAGPFGILVILITRLIAHLSSVMTVKKPFIALSFRQSYYYSTVIAAAPIMLIGLQSVGSIGVAEFLLVIVFVFIGCLYITKRIR